MEIEEKNIVKWQKLKIEAQQQTIDNLTEELNQCHQDKSFYSEQWEKTYKRWSNELDLQLKYSEYERKKNAKLTKEVEGLNKLKHVELLKDAKSQIILLENHSEETIEILGRDYTKRKNKLIEENTKLKEEVEDLANELLFYTSILEGTEQGKTLKENTKLKEGLNDIKSQLFDVNNCDTILTSAIEQILKNK